MGHRPRCSSVKERCGSTPSSRLAIRPFRQKQHPSYFSARLQAKYPARSVSQDVVEKSPYSALACRQGSAHVCAGLHGSCRLNIHRNGSAFLVSFPTLAAPGGLESLYQRENILRVAARPQSMIALNSSPPLEADQNRAEVQRSLHAPTCQMLNGEMCPDCII